MSAEGGLWALVPKSQAVLAPKVDFTASSRAADGVVWHKGSGSSVTLRGVLFPCLLPGCSVHSQVIKPSQVSSSPLSVLKPQILYGSTEEQSLQAVWDSQQ